MATRKDLLAQVAARGRLVASSDAVAVGGELGLSAESVRAMLLGFRKDGWLTSLRRGLDLVTTPGAPHLHPFALATSLTEDATISGWAALHHHGLTEQLPRTTEVMTTRAMRSTGGAKKRLVTFEGERFELLTVPKRRMFGIAEVWLEGARARIFSKERVFLELFIRPGEFGGIETALSMLEEHEADIDARKLVEHALDLDVAGVAKRVGWALENVAGTSEAIFEPLRALSTGGYALLDPSKPARGPRRARWHLRENL